MTNDNLEANIRRELQQITAVLESRLQVRSRWNGTVEIVADGNFLGAKRHGCSIALREDIARDETLRWRTMIHEALHACSSEYSRLQYDTLKGWEEGVVEKLQRLLRPTILSRLGIGVPEKAFDRVDQTHIFNAYITALDGLQLRLNVEAEAFYTDLLKTPLPDRASHLSDLGQQRLAPGEAAAFRAALILAQARLTKNIGG